jgi:hypothetical protein
MFVEEKVTGKTTSYIPPKANRIHKVQRFLERDLVILRL